tara:strand:+ start:9473 stop:12835 length:3363 start_codon:yes stop_codon:yes gene_type:complete
MYTKVIGYYYQIKIVILHTVENSKQHIFNKLNEFISKFYKNQLIRGGIYSVSVLIIFFIVFSVLEYFSQFDIIGRSVLFWSYLILNTYIIYKYVIIPLLNLNRYGKVLSMKNAAVIIGKHFKEIDDKLLNILELNNMSDSDNSLIEASINQKISSISGFPFTNVINFSENKKYGKWLVYPIIILFLFLITGNKHILTESSARIIKHNTFFEPKAPFNFIVNEDDLTVIMQEDFHLKLNVTGDMIPAMVSIEVDNNTFNLQKISSTEYEFVFNNVIADKTFCFSGNGYKSKHYTLRVLPKPTIINFNLFISPPTYTDLKEIKLTNIGDLNIPEGSKVNWLFDVINTDRLYLIINKNKFLAKSKIKNRLHFNYLFNEGESYKIITENDFEISDSISYHINIIKDQYPFIDVEQEIDSIAEKIYFSGSLKDDYKITKLELCYEIINNDSVVNNSINVPIKKLSSQNFFHQIDFSQFKLTLGDNLNYYFKAWDNDGVNGSKFTKSTQFRFTIPTKEKLDEQIKVEENKIKNDLKYSIKMAKDIKNDIKAIEKNMIEKKSLGWEDKQKVNDLIDKQKELQNHIRELKEKNLAKQKKQENFKPISPELLEKQKELEKLFDEILNDETKKMIEELEKMMEKMNKEEMKDLLDKMNKQKSDLEKDLDRNLELFKQLEFEQKLDEIISKLNAVKEKQKELKSKTDEKDSKNNDLKNLQEELKNEFENLKKELKDLNSLNQELEEKNNIEDTGKEEEQILEKMKESKSHLEKNKKKSSSKSQKEILDKLNSLEEKLQNIQTSSCSNQQVENLEALRQILENLIQLSISQEELMQNSKTTPRNSPSYIEIVKVQKKLVDDAKIIEDSLFALSKRVVQIQHKINKEITSIKNNMADATKNLEQRIINKATSDQQFAMTSANNLALILSEMLTQMQQQCSTPSSSSKPSNCNKPSNGKPSLSQLKKMQQRLNDQMKGEMGKKKGKKLNNGQCKNLSILAQQQEIIRQQLQELRNELNRNGEKNTIDKMIKQMEENEIDIVNNKITQQTIRRQEEILSRLLEAEKAEREKEKESKRESNEWQYEIVNDNKSYSDYKKMKERQLELLKTKPAKLSPFYKNKVTEYFNELSEELND